MATYDTTTAYVALGGNNLSIYCRTVPRDIIAFMPSPDDVRKGTHFGEFSELEGTLECTSGGGEFWS